MGLNFKKRGRREELDSPNDFITAGLSNTDSEFGNHDEHLTLLFYKKILQDTRDKIEDIRFD